MKRFTSIPSQVITITAVTILSISTAIAQPATPEDAKYVEDELLVQFLAGVPNDKSQAIAHAHGMREVDEIAAIRVKRFKVPAQALEQVREALGKNPHVKFVEPNYLAEPNAVPNDPSYASQWHLPKISAPQGWDFTTGLSTVDIAIIDSGVDSNHPDLAGKILPGWSFLTGSNDTHDVKGHGTAVAGCASAIGNNGVGVSGVSWNSAIMPLVVLDATNYASYSNIASAITYATDHGVRVMNISIGGASASSTLQNAVNYAWGKGALVIAAAGNSANATPNYPAACTNVIAVASTDSTDNRSSFSTYGTWITLAAPGSNIYTTNNGGGYGAWNGTSFASPITTGMAALVLSVNPTLPVQAVRDIMIASTDDLGMVGFDDQFGNGRINVYKAVQAAQHYVTPSDNQVPIAMVSSPTVGSSVAGAVTVAVAASDNVGVNKVELFVDGTFVASDSNAPYSFYWDSATVADGTHQFEVRAFDVAGNAGSGVSAVVVRNAVDTVAPVVAVTAPKNGASISSLSKVSVKISGSDNVTVKKLELYVDGSLKATSATTSLSYNWSLKAIAAGAHQLTVKGYDAVGNVGESTITVYR